MAGAEDLYGLLGVARGCSAEELKRGYRAAILVHHPDKGGDPEMFKRVQCAWGVLSNAERRAEYDATGRIPGEESDGGGGGGPPDLNEILGSLFGGGGGGGIPFPLFMGGPGFNLNAGGGGGGGGRPAKGPNKVHEIGVGLADLWHGKTFKLTMKRDVICARCEGCGGSRMENCGGCGGRGARMRRQQMGPMVMMAQEICGECRGRGQRVAETCGDCRGKRVVEREMALDVRIEPGMQEGDRLVFAGACSESPDFGAPGDVVLVIRGVAETGGDVTWERQGADLVAVLEFSLAESLLGWERRMEGHPSGRPLHLVWSGGVVREGEVLRVPGWGMPRRSGGGVGDLRLVCRVATVDQPEWSEEQRRALESVWPTWRAPVVEGEGEVQRPVRV
jgi:DnaJ family protein A protein 2